MFFYFGHQCFSAIDGLCVIGIDEGAFASIDSFSSLEEDAVRGVPVASGFVGFVFNVGGRLAPAQHQNKG